MKSLCVLLVAASSLWMFACTIQADKSLNVGGDGGGNPKGQPSCPAVLASSFDCTANQEPANCSGLVDCYCSAEKWLRSGPTPCTCDATDSLWHCEDECDSVCGSPGSAVPKNVDPTQAVTDLCQRMIDAHCQGSLSIDMTTCTQKLSPILTCDHSAEYFACTNPYPIDCVDLSTFGISLDGTFPMPSSQCNSIVPSGCITTSPI